MLKFREFVSDGNGDNIPVVSVSSLNLEAINEQLILSLNESPVNPYIDWVNSRKVLEQFDIKLPNTIFKDIMEGEELVALNLEGTDYYFYYCYHMSEDMDCYESFATVVDESGLEELLREE